MLPSNLDTALTLSRMDTDTPDTVGFPGIDAQWLAARNAWSEKTFGPGRRTKGVLAHIRKELLEIEADPQDTVEWIDVILLALDGAWRHGADPQQVLAALVGKHARNEARIWPDWREHSEDVAIEHDRAS